MGCAPMAHLLFSRYMNYNPKNPKWVRNCLLFLFVVVCNSNICSAYIYMCIYVYSVRVGMGCCYPWL
jgi:transketolase